MIERIRRLPRTIKNPLAKFSAEEKAVKVISDLTSIPEFQDKVGELAEVIDTIRSPKTSERAPYFKHSLRDIEQTIQLLEATVESGALPEVTAEKYLEELRSQRELSLSRPPTLAQRINSTLKPVAYKIAMGTLGNIPLALFRPPTSIEDGLVRIGGTIALVEAYHFVVRMIKHS